MEEFKTRKETGNKQSFEEQQGGSPWSRADSQAELFG